MKLAYLVAAHNTPNHMCRMLKALNSDHVYFFIHIDKKSDIQPYQKNLNLPNITFIQERISVYWGEFSQVQATINLIKSALSSDIKFDYLILISGSDYPLKTPSQISDFFLKNSGKEFINLVEMPNPKASKMLDRIYKYQMQTIIDKTYYRTLNKIINYGINKIIRWRRNYKKVLGDMKLYAGSSWWALSTDACHYILSYIDNHSPMVNFFKNTFFPDESFFHTIIGNSEFSENVTRNLTYTQWQATYHPEFINIEHLEMFKRMGTLRADDVYGRGELLFARKFHDNSAEITQLIDGWIRNYE
ncbi:beta-1,6-N-acetylglucosaminyltransferase [Aliinostoc sp. HNIBRCY26]|uniref:beta-1,6-N-acetylglucosaminyltransferase n=1 Tax=Aliinostoc sp. HNIBRCY26 TaxID=3418997 RepID=UPI003D025E2E